MRRGNGGSECALNGDTIYIYIYMSCSVLAGVCLRRSEFTTQLTVEGISCTIWVHEVLVVPFRIRVLLGGLLMEVPSGSPCIPRRGAGHNYLNSIFLARPGALSDHEIDPIGRQVTSDIMMTKRPKYTNIWPSLRRNPSIGLYFKRRCSLNAFKYPRRYKMCLLKLAAAYGPSHIPSAALASNAPFFFSPECGVTFFTNTAAADDDWWHDNSRYGPTAAVARTRWSKATRLTTSIHRLR